MPMMQALQVQENSDQKAVLPSGLTTTRCFGKIPTAVHFPSSLLGGGSAARKVRCEMTDLAAWAADAAMLLEGTEKCLFP